MTKQLLKFKDSICIAQPAHLSARDDAMKMLDKDSKATLKVTIDATHSGVLTNGRVYPGLKVAEGYKSYISKERGGTAEYDKPVLKHHDAHSDPIGRVISSKYTMFKSGQDFEYDYLNPDNLGSKGSGVVTVEALITDPDSIKKILDGRFVSVSSGHSTDAAYCSTCGESILTCSHVPGKRYDSEGEPTADDSFPPCYVITNKMTYNELSFVNMPAQPPAKLINYNWADCKDNSNDIFVESINTGAKDLVRVFSLVDSSDELNLLTGKKKSDGKKIMVAVKPVIADKLKAALSIPNVVEDDDKTVHPKNNGNTVEQPESDLKAKDNPNEGNTMDAIELQKKVDSLEKDLSVAKAKVTELETTDKAKGAEITKLSEEAKKLDSKMRKIQATSLVGLKMRLKKPDVLGLDTAEKRNALIEKLAGRSAESLEDAINDHMFELDNLKEETKQDESKKTVADIVGNTDKVADVTLAKGEKSTSKDKSKDKNKTVDAFDRELSL